MSKDSLIIGDVELVKTCSACPEQYDAYIDGVEVAYLRLRHGYFYASCPGVSGEVVYQANPEGDGEFEDDERLPFLCLACEAIMKWKERNNAT